MGDKFYTGMLVVALMTFFMIIAYSPARPADIALTCDLVRQGVQLVGNDPDALERLAESYGYKVTPQQRRKAQRCLRGGRTRWASKPSSM